MSSRLTPSSNSPFNYEDHSSLIWNAADKRQKRLVIEKWQASHNLIQNKTEGNYKTYRKYVGLLEKEIVLINEEKVPLDEMCIPDETLEKIESGINLSLEF